METKIKKRGKKRKKEKMRQKTKTTICSAFESEATINEICNKNIKKKKKHRKDKKRKMTPTLVKRSSCLVNTEFTSGIDGVMDLVWNTSSTTISDDSELHVKNEMNEKHGLSDNMGHNTRQHDSKQPASYHECYGQTNQPRTASNTDSLTLDETIKEDLVFSILRNYGYSWKEGAYSKLIKELKSKGLQLSRGKWTEKELCQLNENWERYKAKCPVDPVKVLCPHKHPSERRELRRISKNTCMLSELVFNVKRVYSQTLKKAQILYGDYKWGKFSKEEKTQIVNMRHMGHKWTTISAHTNRFQGELRTLYRNMKLGVNKGTWTKKEDKNLLRIMEMCKTYHPLREEMYYPWETIATLMGSRNAGQCQKRNVCSFVEGISPSRTSTTLLYCF